MKSIIRRGSAKLGGLVFLHKDVECIKLHDWVNQGCPSNVYVQSTPDLLMMCNIPIVDCIADHGVLHKRTPGKLKNCKYKIPGCIMLSQKTPKSKNGSVDYITPTNPFVKKDNMKFHR